MRRPRNRRAPNFALLLAVLTGANSLSEETAKLPSQRLYLNGDADAPLRRTEALFSGWHVLATLRCCLSGDVTEPDLCVAVTRYGLDDTLVVLRHDRRARRWLEVFRYTDGTYGIFYDMRRWEDPEVPGVPGLGDREGIVVRWTNGTGFYSVVVFHEAHARIRPVLRAWSVSTPDFVDIDDDGVREVLCPWGDRPLSLVGGRRLVPPKECAIYKWEQQRSEFVLAATVPWERRLTGNAARTHGPGMHPRRGRQARALRPRYPGRLGSYALWALLLVVGCLLLRLTTRRAARKRQPATR
jgi:hypothetical protein